MQSSIRRDAVFLRDLYVGSANVFAFARRKPRVFWNAHPGAIVVMERFTRSRTALVLVVTAAVCFVFGASTRSDRVASLKGSVIDVVAVQDIPAYVNRWCLIRNGSSPASPTNAAIVEFGEGRRRHRYAYPQTPSPALAARDTVSGEIDTCSIRKIAAAGTPP